jgi:transposase
LTGGVSLTVDTVYPAGVATSRTPTDPGIQSVPPISGEQLAQLRARLNTIEELITQLASELKAIREELHVAAAQQMTPPTDDVR